MLAEVTKKFLSLPTLQLSPTLFHQPAGIITDFVDINHETNGGSGGVEAQKENDFRQSVEYFWGRIAAERINQRFGHSLNGSTKNEEICLETIFMNDLITGAVEKSMKEQVSVTRVQTHENDFEREPKSRSPLSTAAVQMAPDSLSISKIARQVICEAQNKGIVAIIAFFASCDTLYPLIQEAIQSRMVIFVIDDRYCIKVPIRSPFLFIDKTYHSDTTQAITDVVSYNEMKDIVIIYEDDHEDDSVTQWNERIKIEKLIQKLSTNLIRTTLVKISPQFKMYLSSPSPPPSSFLTSFPYIHQQSSKDDLKRQQQDKEASLNSLIDLMIHKIEAFDTGIGGLRSTGVTIVALTERIVLDSLINLIVQEDRFPISSTLFHINDIWMGNRVPDTQQDSKHQVKQEQQQQQPSNYWFDQEQLILKRKYHLKLVGVLRELVINHVPKNRMVASKESFTIAAIESISNSAQHIIKRVDPGSSLITCDLNEGSQSSSSSGGLNPIPFEKTNNVDGPPEKFAEAIHVCSEI